MARGFRRRRPRVVWLPQSSVGQVDASGTDNTPDSSTWHQTVISGVAGSPGDTSGFEVPLVRDTNESELNPTAIISLADLESSGYRLRRIVGNIYIALAPQDQKLTETSASPINNRNVYGFTAGIMVRRENIVTGGSQLAAVGFDEVRPDHVDNLRDPWVWRRTWVLQDPAKQGYGADQIAAATRAVPFNYPNSSDLPGSNWGWQYPGPTQGPNVDQKTARIIGPEERLYLTVSMQTLLNTDVSEVHSAVVFWDFRVLGSMRTQIGNRRNSVR